MIDVLQSTTSGSGYRTGFWDIQADDPGLMNSLMEIMPDAIMIKDTASRYIRINRAAADFLGYAEPSDAIGRTDADSFPEATAREYFANDQLILTSGEAQINTIVQIRSADGALHWSQMTKIPARDAAGGIIGLVCIARDYTAMKQAELTQALLAAIVGTAHDAIVSVTTEGRISSWNHAAEKLYGYTAEEAIGQLVAPMVVPPEGEFEMTELLRRVAGGERAALHETAGLARDGRRFDTSFVASRIFSANGGVLGTAIIAQDVTEQKRAKIALTEANTELDAFSFSVSHDLRAPLWIVDKFSRILVEDYSAHLPEDAQQVLQIVRDGAVQMGQLINDLLDFSRLGREPMRLRRIAPRTIVEAVVRDLSSKLDARLVEFTIDELPECQADPVLLRQIFVNLLSNAVKYSRTRKPAQIRIGALVDETASKERTYFVKDNGVGFDMANASGLFGVFQRLHSAEQYEGTGVGLALVHRMVRRHGGRIWAEATVDQGATFYFTLSGPGTSGNERTTPEWSKGNGLTDPRYSFNADHPAPGSRLP